jgi:AraC-like DNA-binding protein
VGVIWNTRFGATPSLAGLGRPGNVAEQTIDSPDYRFEGRGRRGEHCLFEYTLEGEGVFRDARGEHRVPAGSGFLCVISDPETGYYYPAGSTSTWRIIYFTFRGADPAVRQLTARFGAVYSLPADSGVMARLRDCRRYAGSTLEMTPGEGHSLVAGLLGTLADLGAERRAHSPNAWLVREARRAVRAHLEEDFAVSDLAAELSVSPEHLCRVFRRETGVTPLSYITRARVRRACELLLEGPLSCKEVCSRMGYDNASHFARTFRRVTGTTPREFRRRGELPAF